MQHGERPQDQIERVPLSQREEGARDARRLFELWREEIAEEGTHDDAKGSRSTRDEHQRATGRASCDGHPEDEQDVVSVSAERSNQDPNADS